MLTPREIMNGLLINDQYAVAGRHPVLCPRPSRRDVEANRLLGSRISMPSS
jgi:hypothetical protein